MLPGHQRPQVPANTDPGIESSPPGEPIGKMFFIEITSTFIVGGVKAHRRPILHYDTTAKSRGQSTWLGSM